MEDRHFTYAEVKDCLYEIFDDGGRFCKYSVKYGLNRFTDDGRTSVDYFHPPGSLGYVPMKLSIGIKSLVKNMTRDEYVRDEDMVMILFQGHHENAHLWQRSVAYMQKPCYVEWIKDMAKDRVVMDCFSPFEYLYYRRDLSEMHANRYAMNQISKYFRKKAKEDDRFGDIDVDSPVCDYIRKMYGIVCPYLMQCNNIEDMRPVVSDMFDDEAFVNKFSYVYSEDIDTRDGIFHKMLQNVNLREQLLSAETGKEEADILCRYIGRHYPEYFRGFPCIRDEYVKNNPAGIKERAIDKVMRITPKQWYDLDPDDAMDGLDDGPDF